MEIFHEIKPLKAFLREKNKEAVSVGLVPTMGALHAGHLTLIETAKSKGCLTVCSIFVNPAQFNNSEDLLKYPRTLEADVTVLKKAGCDVLFFPSVEEMYATKNVITFDFGQLDKTMEGEFRPGHFSGVALVVSKLFHIIHPTHAFFGQKDWQQFTIVQQLVKDLNFDLQLQVVPTLREEGGLAMSSRNQRLTPVQRVKARVFYQTLLEVKQQLHAGLTMGDIEQMAKRTIEQDEECTLEYLRLAHRENLTPLSNVEESGIAVLCIAGTIGDVRLIDNILL
jgi:pantoate--beta-alanine ligase